MIFLHDNARLHVAKIVKETLLKLEWEVLPCPTYSPDFRSMQDALADHFFSYEEVQNWVDEWLASMDTALYRRGISFLPERWEMVINNEGKYFD